MSLTKVHTILDRWYWHKARVQRSAPLHHRYKTQETLFPYRYAYSHILHLWPTRLSVVVGKWSGKGTSDSLVEAVDGDIIGEVDELWLFKRYYGFYHAGRSQSNYAQQPVGSGEDLDAGSIGNPHHADEFF